MSRRERAEPSPLFAQLTSGRADRLIAAIALIGIILFGILLSRLQRDTSLDAFIGKQHPAVVARDKVKDLFGLKDPIIITLVDESPGGLFDVESLNLLRWLTLEVSKLSNVDPERVTSLASTTKIVGDGDNLYIEPFYDGPVGSDAQAAEIRAAVEAMPLCRGTLVAYDGQGAIVSVELVDDALAAQTYDSILELISRAPAGGQLRVAGEAAVSGYLSQYLSEDSRRLVPLGFLAVLAIVYFAFRTATSVVLSLVVVVTSVASALGLMAVLGVPYFVITNALPAILVGASVADAIHIMSAFYDLHGSSADRARRRTTAWTALASIWRPVLFTTITTVSGFLGIVLSSSMPPMFWFGVFAIVGLLFALLYSVLFLPVGLCMLAKQPSPVLGTRDLHQPGLIGSAVLAVSGASARHPTVVIGLAAILLVAGSFGATRVQVDREQIDQFKPTEPIVQADMAINARFSGSNHLNVVVETPRPGDLFTASVIDSMRELQNFALRLDHVRSAVSIVDYFDQLDRALADDGQDRAARDDHAFEQQFFLMESGSGPTEWQDKIDAQHQRALVNINVDSGRFSDSRSIIESLQRYIRDHFNSPNQSAYISGRMDVDYHWLEPLAREHAASIAVSMSLVLLAAVALFRSLSKGLLAIVPVALAVVSVYAVMGYSGIWLDAATSMFATIAIGLGVDFGIHTVERILQLRHANAVSLRDAIAQFSATSGRALFVNFLAIFACFCVIGSSNLPTLQRFGGICALAMLASFLASISVIPALLSLLDRRASTRLESGLAAS